MARVLYRIYTAAQLNGNAFGRWGTWSAILFREQLVGEASARGASLRRAGARAAGVVRTPVVLRARCGEVISCWM